METIISAILKLDCEPVSIVYDYRGCDHDIYSVAAKRGEGDYCTWAVCVFDNEDRATVFWGHYGFKTATEATSDAVERCRGEGGL